MYDGDCDDHFFQIKYETGVFDQNSEFACQLELAVCFVSAVTMELRSSTLRSKVSSVNALKCMKQSNYLCPFTVFKLKSSYCQHLLQSEGPLVRSYRTVRLKTRSKILRLMSFNWKRSCQHRLSPTSPLWNHPPPSSFSAFLEPVSGAQGINNPLVWLGIQKK